MTTIKNLGFSFVLVLGAMTGCATSPGKGGGGDGSGSGEGSGSGSGSGSANVPLDATGKYQVQSVYDISQNMPGTVGTVFNDFTAASTDPGKFILDQLANAAGGTVASIIHGSEGFLAPLIDQQIANYAPSFVQTIEQVGTDLGDMAKQFGVNEQFVVSGTAGNYTSVDTAVGVHFTIQGGAIDLNFADYQVAPIVVNGVGVTIDTTGAFKIAEHKLPLSYGKIMQLALDNVIIPMVDPAATNLAGLLADLIDCNAVGQAIADNVGLFSASTYASACSAGLQFGANAIYQEIGKIDAQALQWDESGTAKAVAMNGDKHVDALQLGKWTGTLSYGGTPAPLATATFTGARM